ncbi:MAG: T9SS type A sorting domain-containing protein, partial [Candidatus Kapaibacterium sp.]
QQFSWSYVPDVNKYWFQIADNPSFKTPIVDYDNVGSTEIKAEHLDYGKTYFWRVKSLRVQDSSDWSEVMTFSTLLPPVVLNYPEMNATDIHVEVNLSWSKLDKDILYHLQLSEFNDFSTNLVDVKEINNNYMHIPELKPQTKYYWRVLAYRGEVNSVWSSVGIFTTDEGYDILAPKQISPENASQTLNDVNFLWSQRAKAVSYSLQVAKDPEFLNITHDVKNIDVPQYKIIGFDDNMYYFWRVKSHSLFDSSSWSEVWRFHVINKGQTISLLLPENEALQTPLKGTLEWESISNIEYYNLEISEDNDFDSPIISNDIININRYDYNFDTKNKTYFWRVRYVKEEYVSDWSEVWSFTTMTETVLNTPEIVSSINGKTEVPVEGEIIWSEVDMATDYQVSLSNRQNFSSIFYKQSGIVGTKLNYTNLDYGALYYARVAASNSNSKSQWSDRISFTTELEKPAIVFPPDGAEKVPSKGVITWALSNDIYFYQIQIAIDKNFNSIIIDMDNFDHLIYNYSLGEDAEYFCRVRTYNDTNSSAWSNTVKFKTDGPTSVDVMTEQLLVYPNPSSNFLYINLSGVRSVNEIEIFNLTGSVLSKTSVNDTVMKIDISNLSEGVYFVKVGNIIKPLIKAD